VIADYSARNIERLRTFWDIAREVGRKFVVTTKDGRARAPYAVRGN
jgi:mRNA degradation ribonuclease J1/J2